MLRHLIAERADWTDQAERFGFHFHTMYGDKYWDESRYYEFSLKQIEEDLEGPTQELHAMCLKAAEKVINDDSLMAKFAIPEAMWPVVRNSWHRKDPSLYGRFDFVYDGKHNAKMLEYNADTPTSLYETGFWQWMWLEEQAKNGVIPPQSDQFNSLQEKLVLRFHELRQQRAPGEILYFSCEEESLEDRGTVQYLEDCAAEAGIPCEFINIHDIGEGPDGELTDLNNHVITWMFKLYPLEMMFRDEYARLIEPSNVRFIEPPWKAILSNKAILPLLWSMFPDHPNLLPAFYTEKEMEEYTKNYVKKPIFSREGANITVFRDGDPVSHEIGPYGEEGYIYQALCDLPKYGDDWTLIGSWVIGNQPAGISIREDKSRVTKDMSRFIPHIIS